LKIMTILGTRPEIIRLSLLIKLLDRYCTHVLVDTGQNYNDRLSGIFFRELDVRKPDVTLGVRGATCGEQIGQILSRIEPVLDEHKPDRVLILGDTNSGLCAIIARRAGIPVYHMEAGNRCHDFRVPEESNRRVIDHVSSVLLPYTNRSRDNLLQEGVAAENIHVTGNPIYEVLRNFAAQISASTILEQLSVKEKAYFLATMHRAENVDVESHLCGIVEGLQALHQQYGFPVLCSLHPRTRARAAQFEINLDRAGLRFFEPFGFCDFIHLEQSAFCVLSDSGTVQEETCILRVPSVTLRDVTERPETIECGSNVLAGCDAASIVAFVRVVTDKLPNWQIPPEYLAPDVSDTVVRILLSSTAKQFSHPSCPA
jgi:UDP-N-acetylglucosamine 2-epimerase (non-hydrolysing)